jgi:beta-lactamase superfamily II metal-dependent hydrolase
VRPRLTALGGTIPRHARPLQLLLRALRLFARRSPHVRAVEVQAVNILAACFHGPDADYIGGFVDVFDGFEVDSVHVSGDPKGTLTYNTFLRGVREEGSQLEVVRAGRRMDWGGVQADVIGPPPGKLYSETNDNSVAILLTYATARVLLAGDPEARKEEHSGSYTRP